MCEFASVYISGSFPYKHKPSKVKQSRIHKSKNQSSEKCTLNCN